MYIFYTEEGIPIGVVPLFIILVILCYSSSDDELSDELLSEPDDDDELFPPFFVPVNTALCFFGMFVVTDILFLLSRIISADDFVSFGKFIYVTFTTRPMLPLPHHHDYHTHESHHAHSFVGHKLHCIAGRRFV